MYERTLTDLLLFNHTVAIVNSLFFLNALFTFSIHRFLLSTFKQTFFDLSHLLQRRLGSLVVISDSSIVNCRFPGDRGCCNIEPV